MRAVRPTRTLTLLATTAALAGPVAHAVAETPPPVGWATQLGGAIPSQVAGLPDGSSIVAGDFSGSAAVGGTNLLSVGGSDVFVARLGPGGAVQWAVRAGGGGADGITGLSVLPDGSSAVSGLFEGTGTFGATHLTGAGGDDAFVMRIAPDGTITAAVRGGGTGDDRFEDVAALADGSSVVVGSLDGAGDVNGTALSGLGGHDAVAARILTDGTVAWARSIGGSSSDFGKAVAAFPDGSVAVAGGFGGTATLAGAPLTSTGGTDAFVMRLAANGTPVWAVPAGGAGLDQPNGIDITPGGAIVVAGLTTSASADFGGTTLTGLGDDDVWVAKVTPAGVFAWATGGGGTGEDSTWDVVALPDGGAAIPGITNGAVTFGATTLPSTGSTRGFVARIGADGDHRWASPLTGTGLSASYGVGVTGAGDILITSVFTGTLQVGNTSLTATGFIDGAILRFGAVTPAPDPPSTPAPDASPAPQNPAEPAEPATPVSVPGRRSVRRLPGTPARSRIVQRLRLDAAGAYTLTYRNLRSRRVVTQLRGTTLGPLTLGAARPAATLRVTSAGRAVTLSSLVARRDLPARAAQLVLQIRHRAEDGTITELQVDAAGELG